MPGVSAVVAPRVLPLSTLGLILRLVDASELDGFDRFRPLSIEPAPIPPLLVALFAMVHSTISKVAPVRVMVPEVAAVPEMVSWTGLETVVEDVVCTDAIAVVDVRP